VGDVVDIVGKTLRAVVGAERSSDVPLDPEEEGARRALAEAREAAARAQKRLDVALGELDTERERQAEEGKLDSRRLTEARRVVSAAEDEHTLARRIEARAEATLTAVCKRIGARREAQAVCRAHALMQAIEQHGGKAVEAMDELRTLYAGPHQHRLPPPLAMWTDASLRHWLKASLAILTGGDEVA
jgi:hypothetical protein